MIREPYEYPPSRRVVSGTELGSAEEGIGERRRSIEEVGLEIDTGAIGLNS